MISLRKYKKMKIRNKGIRANQIKKGGSSKYME
jgi:hypothetical protein